MRRESEIYEAMAKKILTCHNGLMLIEAIRTVSESGEQPTLVNISEMLNMMGCETLPKTNRHVPTMKKWLEKAKVLKGWDIKEKVLERMIGFKNEEISTLKGLNHVQICFVKALCNSDNGSFQSATKIRELAKNSFNVTFEEKSFAANIIRPLEEKNIIEKKASMGIDDADKHVKGLALEAFAIKMMRIVDLNFIGTRVKGSETGGAEVDVIFDTTRLNYSRQIRRCSPDYKGCTDERTT